jgi:hypothetical protein
MKNSTLTKLALVAAALLLGVVWLKNRGTSADVALSGEALVVPSLAAQLNNVSAIKLTGASNTPIITLTRTDKGWVASSINNYGADISKIRDYLIKLSEAKIQEAKTANPDSYAKLGVEDISVADAKGVQLELEGLKAPVKLILGSIAGTGGQGVYVRTPGEKQSYLASGQIRPEASVNSWIQADIAHIPSARIQEVSITPPNGAALVVRKASSADADWAVQNVPKGKEVSGPSAGNSAAGVLDSLRLESVQPAASAQPELASTFRTRYVTFEGLVVEVMSWENDGKSYARFSASLNTEASETYLLAEQVSAEAAAKAAQAATPAAPGSGIPAVLTPATAPAFDAAKFRAEKLAELNKQVAEINARTAGWSYVLPAYKFSDMRKSMADMYKADGAPTQAAGTEADPITFPLH